MRLERARALLTPITVAFLLLSVVVLTITAIT